jgi:TonB family protein
MPSPLFTEVTLMGVLPLGNSVDRHSLETSDKTKSTPAQGLADAAQDKSVAQNGDVVIKKSDHKSTKLTHQEAHAAFLKKRIKDSQKIAKDAPIGMQGGGVGDDLAKAEQGGQYGVPQGAEVKGLLAMRKILFSSTPPYPEWAKQEGVEATVSLSVGVLPNGAVDTAIKVNKTSGYRALDQLALQYLLKWQFEPLPSASVQEKQWGTVIFFFALIR